MRSRVARVDEGGRGFHDAVQDVFEIQLSAHREHRFQQAVHPVARAPGGVEPGLEFLQQLVQPQLWQVDPGFRLVRAVHG
ncbi:hypothetical protein RKD44_000478 [Streptomyces collinus]